jgi:Ribonuclease G/E
MSCWKCPKCGATNCDIETCTVCYDKGRAIKQAIREEKLKKCLEDIGNGTYPCDSDYKGFIREDI